jgi:adenylate cyclase
MTRPSPSSGGTGGADFLLDALRAALADQQIVVAADVADDRFIHLVAADADRAGIDDAAQRQPPTSVAPPPISTTIAIWVGDPNAGPKEYVARWLSDNPFRRQEDYDLLLDGVRKAGLPV